MAAPATATPKLQSPTSLLNRAVFLFLCGQGDRYPSDPQCRAIGDDERARASAVDRALLHERRALCGPGTSERCHDRPL
jgi:hypothetical protein